jgi:hypothetical protein
MRPALSGHCSLSFDGRHCPAIFILMKLIDKWLKSSQNFIVGAAIYKTIGKDPLLKNLFEQAPTDYSRKRLLEELTRLNAVPAAVVVDGMSMSTASLIVAAATKAQEWQEMPSGNDAVLRSLQEQWKPLYARMNYLRHELDQFKGNTPEMIERRKPMASEILQLEKQCINIWARRDHYMKEGRLPDDQVKQKKDEIPTDPVKLGRYLEGLARNIRRNKFEMEKQPDKPEFAQRFKDYSEKYFAAAGNHYKAEA